MHIINSTYYIIDYIIVTTCIYYKVYNLKLQQFGTRINLRNEINFLYDVEKHKVWYIDKDIIYILKYF